MVMSSLPEDVSEGREFRVVTRASTVLSCVTESSTFL